MCKLLLIAFSLAAAPAVAQTPPPGQASPPSSSDVTVQGPERLVCRQVRRTGTRMRAARVCRPVSQLTGADARSDDERLAEAADTLETLGEKVSTGDVGGMGREHDTPLGPR